MTYHNYGDDMRNTEQKWHFGGWLCLILFCTFLMFRGVKILRRNHFSEGKAVLFQAAGQAERLSAKFMMPLLSFAGEEEQGWLENLLAAVRDQVPAIRDFSIEKETEQAVSADNRIGKEEENAEKSGQEEKTATEENVIKENREAAGKTEKKGENTTESKEKTTEKSMSGSEKEENGVGKENADTEENTGSEKDRDLEENGTDGSIQTGGTPLEILYPAAETKKETISEEILSSPQALLNSFFVVDPNTTVLPGQIERGVLLEKDLTMQREQKGPQILIYHTHSQETFTDSRQGTREDSVIGLGDYLQEILEKQYGYGVLHITEAFDLKEGYLERSRAYNYAEPVIAKALEEYPAIQVVIDLHRDGVNDAKHLVTEINGKPTAQIMFFNGLSRTRESGELTSLPNPYQAENLAFAFQMEYLARQYYPGFVRCIYLKGYRYNLHLRPRSVLLEVGAQTNTVEEVKNAMGPFADILHKVLSGEAKEK